MLKKKDLKEIQIKLGLGPDNMWRGLLKCFNKQIKLHVINSNWKMTHSSCYNFIILKPLITSLQWNMLLCISSVVVPVSLWGLTLSTNVIAISILCIAMKKRLLEKSTAFLKVSTFCLSLWNHWLLWNIKWQHCYKNYVSVWCLAWASGHYGNETANSCDSNLHHCTGVWINDPFPLGK